MIMKTILNIRHGFALMLVLLMGIGTTSCVDNNEDAPPAFDFKPGTHITIKELKALYDEEMAKNYKERIPVEIKDDITIRGIVTTNDNLNGNIYKEAYVEDATGGLLMRLNTTGALGIGDSIMVNLKGLFLGDYGDFVQLGSTPYIGTNGSYSVNFFDVDEYISRFSFMNPTIPTEVSMSLLKSNLNEYLGRLVKLDGVQFADSEKGNTYAVAAKDGEEAAYGNRNLQDCYKNTVVVRSSGYATFADVLLPEGNGSIVGIVTKYTSTVQFIIRDINEVKLNGDRCSGNIFGTPAGSGTKEDPYNMAWVLNGNQPTAEVWVKGYIVGSADGVAFDAGLSLEAPFVGASNIAIATSPDETNAALMVPVQLPAGAIRSAINLKDNPGNHKREVIIKGLAQDYFNKKGIKAPTGYWWVDTNDGVDPGGSTDPGTGSTIFTETFEAGIGNFKAFSIKGSQAWNHDASYKYMKMSGNQSGSNHENEDWLVSPQISLSGVSNAKLTFDHTGKVFNAPLTDMTVWVSTNFDGSDVTTANWTKVDIPTYMSGNDWVFVNSGEISLSEFNNESKIFIAFKYISTDTLAATWEIKNVEVKK